MAVLRSPPFIFVIALFLLWIAILFTGVAADDDVDDDHEESTTPPPQGLLSPSSFVDQLRKVAKSGYLNGLSNLLDPKTLANPKQVIGTLVNATGGPPVRFYLYNSPLNPIAREELRTDDLTGLSESLYNASKPVKLLIHPWLGVPIMVPVIFPFSAKNSYLLTQGNKYNIILMDYTQTTGYPAYPLAATVGFREAVAEAVKFLSWLHEEEMIDLKKLHIIGLSLGAHIAGAVAKGVKNRTSVSVGRVTGLDPVGPLFVPAIPLLKTPHVIGRADAQYVDVAHTNALIAGLGMMKDGGQADIHLNGGIMQEICQSVAGVDATTKIPGSGLALITVCNHLIAGEYFSLSIWRSIMNVAGNKKGACACTNLVLYMANPICCNARVIFGEHTAPGTRGKYYLRYIPVLNS